MKVKELIEQLRKCDPESIVILQKDSEGNGYSPIAGVDSDDLKYVKETSYSGEVKYSKLTREMEEAGYSEEDLATDGEDCVVLFPIN